MTRSTFLTTTLTFVFAAVLGSVAYAQASPQLKRTTFKTETFEAGPASTLSLIGSPRGSIRIEGWNRNEIEISAEIEVAAGTEEDLTRLASVTGFLIDEGLTKISVETVGPHDKKYLKKVDNKFPKHLRNSPFVINYSVKVPRYTDLIISGGIGEFDLKGVEGSFKIDFLESIARMALTGGSISATFGKADVSVVVEKRSWRGRFAEIQVAAGNLDVKLPSDMNANLSAKVLRTGKIENGFSNVKPKRLTKFTDTFMDGIAGNGGASLGFTVGDGILKISEPEKVRIAEN